MKETFAGRIKAERTRVGLSKGEFSKAINVPRRTLQSWEKGEAVPEQKLQKTVFALCKKLK